MNKKTIKLIVISIMLIFGSFAIVSTNFESNKYLVLKNTNFKKKEGINLSSPNFSFIFSPQSKIVNLRIYDNRYECSYSDLEKAKIIFNNKYFECIDSTLLLEKYSLEDSEFEEVLKVIEASSLEFSFSESRLSIQNSKIIQLELIILFVITFFILHYSSNTIKKILQNRKNQNTVVNLCVFAFIILTITSKNVDPNIRKEMNYNQISTKGVSGTTQLSIKLSKINFDIRNVFIDLEIKRIPEGKISIAGSKNLIDMVIDKDMINIQNVEWAQNLNSYRLPHNCVYPCKINFSFLDNKSFIINVNSKILLYAPIKMKKITPSDLFPTSINNSGTLDETESRLYVESIDLRKYSVTSLVGMITIIILLFFSLMQRNSLRKLVSLSDKNS
jgi:hypothetical protein